MFLPCLIVESEFWSEEVNLRPNLMTGEQTFTCCQVQRHVQTNSKVKKINFLNAFSWTFWIKNQNSFLLNSARSCPPVSVSSSRRFWLLILKCSSTMSVCWFDGPGQSYHGKLVTLQWSANLYLTLRIVRLLKLQSLQGLHLISVRNKDILVDTN